jgi:hypothetical protein
MAPVDRISVTMPPEIGANWLVAAAAQRLRNELLGAALDRWEEEEGPFSDEELDAAAAALSTTRRRAVV